MRTESIYHKTFPASVENIFEVIGDIICILERNYINLNNGEFFNIKVILNELLVNAIRHGCKDDSSKCVSVDCSVRDDKRLLLKIRDDGCGYNYSNILEQEIYDVFSIDNEIKECGRGILIVKNLCEDLIFNGKGNEIEVIYKL